MWNKQASTRGLVDRLLKRLTPSSMLKSLDEQGWLRAYSMPVGHQAVDVPGMPSAGQTKSNKKGIPGDQKPGGELSVECFRVLKFSRRHQGRLRGR